MRAARLASFSLAVVSLCAAAAEPPAGSYRVEGGKVDQGTFLGWVTYHTACHICHGRDATGTDIAPDLRQSLKAMSAEEFASKVSTRYRIFVGPTEALSTEQQRQAVLDEVIRQQRGRHGTVSMPAWRSNAQIEPHILDLYAYLKARSDGALGPGQPQVIDKK